MAVSSVQNSAALCSSRSTTSTVSSPLTVPTMAGISMPSKAEPCGLSQLIAMRYGTVPVVNATGGLRDTVTPYDPTTGEGRGFTFQSYNADDFLASIDRALALYYDAPEQFEALARQDMLVDSSWTLPAKEYMQLYQSVCGG